MWDQVHIVIAIPTRYAVFTGDNISGCGYWGSTAGGDEAVIRNWIRRQAKRTSAWTKSTLGYPYRKGPRRDAAGRLNERWNCSRTEFVPYQAGSVPPRTAGAPSGFEIGSSRGCARTGPSCAPADGGQRNPVKSWVVATQNLRSAAAAHG